MTEAEYTIDEILQKAFKSGSISSLKALKQGLNLLDDDKTLPVSQFHEIIDKMIKGSENA